MKKVILSMAALACALILSSCNSNNAPATATAEETADGPQKGAIVYFDIDRVMEEYDMANDLRSTVETKVNSINQEVNRRGSKLEKEAKAFQDKVNKGLLTQSVAEIQYRKLQEQEQQFNQYAAQKQQEIAEEQQVMLNNITDAIKTFVDEFNADKQYAMILCTQGAILPAPVVTADPELDITDAIIEGINAKYVAEKGTAKAE